MKKVIKVAAMFVSVGFIAWFILSWVDIVVDNTQPNPHHSKYNMFVVFFSDKEDENPDKDSLAPIEYEEEPVENTEGQCGSPLTDRTRLATAIINAIDDNTLTLTTVEDGEQWTVEVGYGESFSMDDYLCVFFDTMETENIYDDEIVKLWVERW